MNRNLILAGVSLASVVAWSLVEPPRDSRETTLAVVGNPDLLHQRYDAWKARRSSYLGGDSFEIGLTGARGHLGGPTSASGRVALDFEYGLLEAEVVGLAPEASVDLWLVDDHAGEHLRVGTLWNEGEAARLETDLDSLVEGAFQVDSIVVCESTASPEEGALLYGSPTLFQRLYFAEVVAQLEADEARLAGLGLAMPAMLDVETGFGDEVFSDLVTLGEELFFNETFNGNGRTCGTCHPAENNFTLDPDFIATLPADDPLFVAEFVPELNSDLNGGLVFENPTLMREKALIVANVDGFGDLTSRFVMRGVSHTLGLPAALEGDGPALPAHRTGWGGDGAPVGEFGDLTATGSLRDFAIGATIQHFPLTMNREIGVDFRLPTAGELDAMEAFQLSLGRDEDPDLDSMVFLDPETENGKDLFVNGSAGSTPPFFSCTQCHENAGAKRQGENQNRATGTEEFLVNNPDTVGQLRPIDGGFGTSPSGGFPGTPIANADGSFGNREFNIISAIEAAETEPLFHNNVATTLRDSIEFYASDEFFIADNRRIVFTDSELDDVERFLRVLNYLDNVDHQAPPYGEKALIALSQPEINEPLVTRLMDLAIANCNDAADSLRGMKLHKDPDLADAFKRARKARNLFKRVKDPSFSTTSRIKRCTKALGALVEGHNFVVQ